MRVLDGAQVERMTAVELSDSDIAMITRDISVSGFFDDFELYEEFADLRTSLGIAILDETTPDEE